jgi:hypothetical protein
MTSIRKGGVVSDIRPEMTREDWIVRLERKVENFLTAEEIVDDFATFVALWIERENGHGDEGAILNGVLWRKAFLPDTITEDAQGLWDYYYGTDDD